MRNFVFYKQLNTKDCGPTCLRMVAKYYGKHYVTDTLRQIAGYNRSGVSLLGISNTAENIGFRTRAVKITYDQLLQVGAPCILHWDQNHYVVFMRAARSGIKVADPAKTIINYKKKDFLSHWSAGHNDEVKEVGIALLLEPTALFYERDNQKEQALSWAMILRYLRTAKWRIVQIFIALIITSLLSLIFPFLTQSIVDTGINTRNLQYVTVVLVAQVMLTFSQTVVDFIKNRILLTISNVLIIQILSDFWIKLMRLPVAYFNIHHTGDTIQRIGDHKKIQSFLTGAALNTLFSVVNFMIYASVLIIYSVNVFLVFCVGSLLYFCWVQLFLHVRRKINYESFALSSKENTATLQMIQGMQEIRLNNAEKRKRWEWEDIQANLFALNTKSLNYGQVQSAGAVFINQVQGIVISFFVAKLVIDGHLSLGSMLAIQYVIGQLNAPVQQWVGFTQNFQDAKISLERLNEIHQLKNEEDGGRFSMQPSLENKTISINNLSFSYPGTNNELVLENINLIIPQNKITAIVGASGSGKTTLVKLLLKIYDDYAGEIKIGANIDGSPSKGSLKFNFISHQYWRSLCGPVLQDGYIFNDSIARNIAVGQEEVDYAWLIQSCRHANIHSFIETLPNGYHTKLGDEGIGVSQGQKQRILIARAIYKNPLYLFFDEATNALDASNEKEIVENLNLFLQGRTAVIVAHRLSTVRNADKIVVLDKGKIIEEGTHEELTVKKGKYYELVKNQLELGI